MQDMNYFLSKISSRLSLAIENFYIRNMLSCNSIESFKSFLQTIYNSSRKSKADISWNKNSSIFVSSYCKAWLHYVKSSFCAEKCLPFASSFTHEVSHSLYQRLPVAEAVSMDYHIPSNCFCVCYRLSKLHFIHDCKISVWKSFPMQSIPIYQL